MLHGKSLQCFIWIMLGRTIWTKIVRSRPYIRAQCTLEIECDTHVKNALDPRQVGVDIRVHSVVICIN
jgi:hypothetical protein